MGCGKWIDDPNDITKGYKFTRGKVLYQRAEFWWGSDSTKFTADSFLMEDTIGRADLYIVSKNRTGLVPVPPVPSANYPGGIEFPKHKEYGITNSDKEIVVFPVFKSIFQITEDLCVVSFVRIMPPSTERTGYHPFGVLDARNGKLLTEIQFDSLRIDSQRRKVHVYSGDSLYDAVSF